MSIGDTKAEIINGAFSKLKISGITVDPSPEDNELALGVMESMMHEYSARNRCLGYNFEDFPDTGSKHNIPSQYWDAVKSVLAVRLAPDFGKGDSAQINPVLLKMSAGAESMIFSGAATPRQTQYPSRQPIGSGNTDRFNHIRRFYPSVEQVPSECESKSMYIGDVSDFVEDFNDYMTDSELIDTFTIESNTGLTILSSAKNATETAIDYQIRADGGNEFLKLKIVITTTDGRIETRIINFQLQTAEI